MLQRSSIATHDWAESKLYMQFAILPSQLCLLLEPPYRGSQRFQSCSRYSQDACFKCWATKLSSLQEIGTEPTSGVVAQSGNMWGVVSRPKWRLQLSGIKYKLGLRCAMLSALSAGLLQTCRNDWSFDSVWALSMTALLT